MVWWDIPGLLDVREGGLYVGGVRVQGIAETFGIEGTYKGERPLFVYSPGWLKHNVAAARSELKGARLFFSPHNLDVLEMPEVAREEGLGFNAASPIEVELALRMGFKPEDIILTGEQSPRTMVYSAMNGITVSVSSQAQLDDLFGLVERYPKLQGSGCMLRYKWCGHREKAGIREDALQAHAARMKDNGLLFRGYYRNSGLITNSMYRDSFVRDARRLSELTAMAIEAGARPDAIYHGGDFGTRYMGTQHVFDLGELHEEVMEIHTKVLGGSDVRVLLEPGSRITDCGIMLAQVIRKGKEYCPYVRVNACLPDDPNLLVKGEYRHVFPVADPLRNPMKETRIVGETCESGDAASGGAFEMRMAPVGVGEWLAVLNLSGSPSLMDANYARSIPPMSVIAENGVAHLARAPTEKRVSPDCPEYLEALEVLEQGI